MRSPFSFLPRLWTSFVTLLGSILAALAAAAFVVLFAIEAVTGVSNTYTSGILFLALPAIFVLGLLLIPLGFLVARRRRPAAPDPIGQAFAAALADRSARHKLAFVAGATGFNVVLLGVAAHGAIGYLDSPSFCGTACHSVMQPEWDAYQASPHARVACVECHIGPGASWAVRSKIDGLRQVVAIVAGSYERPIPTPVHELRPSRDTCEKCHWPEQFHGERVAAFPGFGRDRASTPAYDVLLLHVGGADPTGRYAGIHWHVAPDREVRYEVLDRERRRIGRIEVLEHGRTVATFAPPESAEAGPVLETRRMDCVDCHNRPTHRYDASPEAAVDRALAEGRLDRGLPWIAAAATAALARDDVPREGARPALRAALEDAYRRDHPEEVPAPASLDGAADVLAELYLRNVYPGMRVGWGTYPSHVGHPEDEGVGCFRCHDDERSAILADGTTRGLSQDCELCHATLAFEEDPENFDETLRALLPPPAAPTARTTEL